MSNPAKLGYLSGPVDARRIYASLRGGSHTDLFGTSYMLHLMRLCEDQGREAIIVTTHAGSSYSERHGPFLILNRPPPGGTGLRYHWRQPGWVRDCIAELEALGARIVILTAAQHYWMVTPPFRERGMRFINSYHCAVRAVGHRFFSPHELAIRVTSHRHLSHGDPTMIIAPTIRDELAREPGAGRRKVLQLLPDYPRQMFAGFAPPAIAENLQNRVRVMFAGRVARNKGVFDIVTMAENLAGRAGVDFEFHIHGEGDALGPLREVVDRSPAGNSIVLHGFTPGARLRDFYAMSDIVVVPTRSDFDEGIAKSVVEGVLTLRPVVTSRACPSVHMLAQACLEAKMNDPSSYAEAIYRLSTDPQLVRTKVKGARLLRERFFDPPERYDRRLREALALIEA